ncbi:hypothetical protein CKM354_000029000 [Cercospora kikuchii]|uniref:Uncharacterized protein n=1 Tax=Cercospora kikuchii TaxID=84275 RepID=A0A9P3CDN0_9PEZI|nr:uncharacterized protein CKM354_000029000 [Cercospora kikuchii]GIZ36823.1 hypothetical protein CKM354_000029000 [Cercospora kikuchii]
MAQRQRGLPPGYQTCTAINFTRRKLCVGHRLQDFVPVWFMPRFDDGGAIKQDDDGTVAPNFFKVATRGRASREPMPSEIHWLPYYDPAYYDARDKRDKYKKQMQFLGDAWKYLSENDPDAVAELEEEMDQPDYRKWQIWFDAAKVYKQGKLRERRRRRVNRTQMARESDIPMDDADINSDSSAGEDSGYEEEEDERPVRATQKRPRGVDADMPPPPLGGDTPGHRSGGNESNGPARKRAKLKPRAKKGKDAVGRDDQDGDQHLASGGLPAGGDYFANTGRDYVMDGVEESSIALSEHSNNRSWMPQFHPTATGVEYDYDDQNNIFDPSTPEPPASRANSRAGSTTGPLFVSRHGTMSQSGHGSRPPSRRTGATATPIPDLSNGLTGYGALFNTQESASRSSSGHRNRPNSHVQSPTARSQREGSVMSNVDRNNGGMNDDDAMARAVKASEEHEKLMRQVRERLKRQEVQHAENHDLSVDIDQAEAAPDIEREAEQQPQNQETTVDSSQPETAQQAEHDAEQQVQNQDPTVGGGQLEAAQQVEREADQPQPHEDPPGGEGQAEAARPEMQDHPTAPNEPDAAASDESDVEDLTGDD